MEIIDMITGAIHNAAGFVMTFFGALANFNNARVLDASGVDGMTTSFEMVKTLVEQVIGLFSGASAAN